jgi:RHS repeat-associated protein
MARAGDYTALERHDYFPYGEERTPSIGDRNKFGTYHRDQTGLDYADQRYYNSTIGRFLSADPYEASGGTSEPASWGRGVYVHGDPVNFNDSAGLARCNVTSSVDLLATVWCISRYSSFHGETEVRWSGPFNAEKEREISNEAASTWGKFLDAEETKEMISSAISQASDRIFTERCSSLFLAFPGDRGQRQKLSNRLQAEGDRGTFRAIEISSLPPTTNPNVGGFTTGLFGVVYLVHDRYFFTGTDVGGKPIGEVNAEMFGGLTLDQIRASIIIHEAIHLFGVAGSDSNGERYQLPDGTVLLGSAGIQAEVRRRCF